MFQNDTRSMNKLFKLSKFQISFVSLAKFEGIVTFLGIHIPKSLLLGPRPIKLLKRKKI